MSKWKCEKCGTTVPCVLDYGEASKTNPALCVIGKYLTPNWQEVKEETEKKKETALPDWCKVGEWVWTITYDAYFMVDEVNELFIVGEDCYGDNYSVTLEKARPARLRPYNAEEMKKLVGKVLQYNTDSYLVTAFENRLNQVKIESVWRDADELMKVWICLDGKPCGVMEHLENGEWIE